MSHPRLIPLDAAGAPDLPISARLRSQLPYFAAAPGQGDDEFAFSQDEAAMILDEGVIRLVSPLDTANTTEVEISEEQEALLLWLTRHKIGRVRVVD